MTHFNFQSFYQDCPPQDDLFNYGYGEDNRKMPEYRGISGYGSSSYYNGGIQPGRRGGAGGYGELPGGYEPERRGPYSR